MSTTNVKVHVEELTPDRWVTINFAADITGRPRRTIQSWARRGHIPQRRRHGRVEVQLDPLLLHSKRRRDATPIRTTRTRS